MIRPMTLSDGKEVLAMMRVFYDSPAVLTKSPDEVLLRDIRDSIGDCPFLEGYVFEVEECIAGYAMLAKSYSTEFGGLCIWIEDLYMKPEFRGQKLGTEFFAMLDQKYAGTAVRFRLEAELENEQAIALYKKSGFHVLPYVEMTKEI